MLVRAHSVGLSSDRLQKIDRFLERHYIEAGKLPGAQLLVARGGEIAHLSSLGRMDVERDRPLGENTIFRIYSMTKPITSVAFMMLVEEGLVMLDDPVHKYIPEWKDLGVYVAGTEAFGFKTAPCARPMQIVDLLRHTAGLTYGFQMRTNVDAAYRQLGIGVFGPDPLEAMVAKLAKLPLEFSPGTAWNYSVATDVIGYLVAKISGQSFESFLQERIFDPLGMTDTGFVAPADKLHRLAACYEWTPQAPMRLQDDPETSMFRTAPAFVSGGGGLVSTIQDYYRFCRMLLGGGMVDGVRLISRKTLGLMTMNHLPGGADLPTLSTSLFSEAAYGGIGFGLGFATTIDPAKALIPGSAGDFFWGGMASTFFWVDPAEDLICLFMTQLMPSTLYPVRRELRTMVYSAIDD